MASPNRAAAFLAAQTASAAKLRSLIDESEHWPAEVSVRVRVRGSGSGSG